MIVSNKDATFHLNVQNRGALGILASKIDEDDLDSESVTANSACVTVLIMKCRVLA